MCKTKVERLVLTYLVTWTDPFSAAVAIRSPTGEAPIQEATAKPVSGEPP